MNVEVANAAAGVNEVDVSEAQVKELERLVRRVRKEGLTEEESKRLRAGLQSCRERLLENARSLPPTTDQVSQAIRTIMEEPSDKYPSKTRLEAATEAAEHSAARGDLSAFGFLAPDLAPAASDEETDEEKPRIGRPPKPWSQRRVEQFHKQVRELFAKLGC